jgi:tetratricopeptide (TPR) repeat protein
MQRILISLLATAALTACEQGPEPLSPRFQGPDAPAGVETPTEAADQLVVGHRLMEAGHHELALKAYVRAVAQNGATPQVLAALGSANLRLGRLGQSERLLRQAIAADQTFVPAWNNLGVVLMERGETGEAKEMFRRAFALDSGRSDHIRENLRLAIARTEAAVYDPDREGDQQLLRQGPGSYRLITQ